MAGPRKNDIFFHETCFLYCLVMNSHTEYGLELPALFPKEGYAGIYNDNRRSIP